MLEGHGALARRRGVQGRGGGALGGGRVADGVADHLEQGPADAATLAERLGVHAQPLHRALRLLATAGIFAEDEEGRFSLTPAAALLRTDAPGSMRDAIRMLTHTSFWAPAGQLSTTIRQGQTPFAEIFGAPFFGAAFFCPFFGFPLPAPGGSTGSSFPEAVSASTESYRSR